MEITPAFTMNFIITISALVALYLIGRIILNLREIKRLRAIKYVARTQHSFGEARSELLRLVSEGKLKDESLTFLILYQLDTLVLRNPDSHKKLAARMRESFLNGNGLEDAEFKEEAIDDINLFTEEIKHLIRLHIDATTFLILANSSFLQGVRTLIFVFAPLLRKALRLEFDTLAKATSVVAKRDSSVRVFVESRNALKRLA